MDEFVTVDNFFETSAATGIIASMFDSEFSTADDATVVAAIEEGARVEAAAGARRLAAIAELARRRVVDDDERANCAFDGWASAAAEVAAAMTVGHRRASAQMRIAVALRDRLPRVASLRARTNGARSRRTDSIRRSTRGSSDTTPPPCAVLNHPRILGISRSEISMIRPKPPRLTESWFC